MGFLDLSKVIVYRLYHGIQHQDSEDLCWNLFQASFQGFFVVQFFSPQKLLIFKIEKIATFTSNESRAKTEPRLGDTRVDAAAVGNLPHPTTFMPRFKGQVIGALLGDY